MRWFVSLVLALALGVMGCSEASGTGGDGGSGGIGGSAGHGGTGGDGGDGGTGGDGSFAPVLWFVAWNWVEPCDINASGQGLVVEIYATVGARPATPEDQLTYSGEVQGCTGDLNAMRTTLSCEVYLGARQGEATVTDPQGHEETMLFAPASCTNDCEPGCPGKG